MYSSWSSVMVRAFRSRVMRMPSIHVAVPSSLMLKRCCSSATLSLELRRVVRVVAALHVVDETVNHHQPSAAAALEVQRRVAHRRLECHVVRDECVHQLSQLRGACFRPYSDFCSLHTMPGCSYPSGSSM